MIKKFVLVSVKNTESQVIGSGVQFSRGHIVVNWEGTDELTIYASAAELLEMQGDPAEWLFAYINE